MSRSSTTGAEFHPGLSLAELVQLSRRTPPSEHTSAGHTLRVAVLANFSTQFLTLGLKAALSSRGIRAQIYEAGYNQWEQDLLDPASGLYAFQPDAVLISLTSGLLAAGQTDDDALAARLADLIGMARSRIAAHMLVTLPEPLEEEADSATAAYTWRTALTQRYQAALTGKATLIDLTPLILQAGAEVWYSTRYLINAKLPANPQTTAQHADYLARFLAPLAAQPVRLIITDLDDTMWSGIVGEVGWSNIDLDREGDGFCSLRYQRFLLGLYERGVLLAICSKNNPEDALAVFRNRPEMLLKENHFAAIQINWDLKSVNVAAILKSLNLTATGAVFIDDSPFERGEVQAAHPDIWVPAFPTDAADLVPTLTRSGRFSIPASTQDDLSRNAQYAQEKERQTAAASSATIDDYYRSLELKLTPRPLTEQNLQRATDLIGKTNQFNLTTRRYSRAELAAFANTPNTDVLTYSLSDRFGDYGQIAVVILRQDGTSVTIDTWLMSCRAMGRTVEKAIFRHLFDHARTRGATRICGAFIPTQKNAPVAKLYEELGFRKIDHVGETVTYVYEDMNKTPGNAFVEIMP